MLLKLLALQPFRKQFAKAIGFTTISKTTIAVAAKRWGRHPRGRSHSNMFFENVVKPKVLATFWGTAADADGRTDGRTH